MIREELLNCKQDVFNLKSLGKGLEEIVESDTVGKYRYTVVFQALVDVGFDECKVESIMNNSILFNAKIPSAEDMFLDWFEIDSNFGFSDEDSNHD